MKIIALLSSLIMSLSTISAQNPFEPYNYTPPLLTLSEGKYLEFAKPHTLIKIGSVYYNTDNHTIESFEGDSILNDEKVSRWASLDPVAIKFSAWSPYNYALNNPVYMIDPDGREATKHYSVFEPDMPYVLEAFNVISGAINELHNEASLRVKNAEAILRTGKTIGTDGRPTDRDATAAETAAAGGLVGLYAAYVAYVVRSGGAPSFPNASALSSGGSLALIKVQPAVGAVAAVAPLAIMSTGGNGEPPDDDLDEGEILEYEDEAYQIADKLDAIERQEKVYLNKKDISAKRLETAKRLRPANAAQEEYAHKLKVEIWDRKLKELAEKKLPLQKELDRIALILKKAY